MRPPVLPLLLALAAPALGACDTTSRASSRDDARDGANAQAFQQDRVAGSGTQALTSGRGATGFDATRAWTHLEHIVAIGPRPAGSAQIRQTRAYITRQMAVLGLTVQEQPFTAETPVGRVAMANLIVRLPGRRAERILITGHYDTKLMRRGVFVGANDGGSSTALLIELARVLQARPREFTYELVWFDGEEAFCENWSDCGGPGSPDNTYGSRYYVQAATAQQALSSIKAMILVDMVADRQLDIKRDPNSTRALTDVIWRTAHRLGHAGVFLDDTLPVEDDHIPFLRAGVPAVDIIDLNYAPWHTPDDTLDKLSAGSLQAVGDVVVAALDEIR